jgi:predicted ATPase
VRLRAFEVAGYRSLRSIALDLSSLTVVAGPNGSGKTNLYRALYLLHTASTGRLARTIADEGGMPSVLWAGTRGKKEPKRLRLAASIDELDYELECGLPTSKGPVAESEGPGAFVRDPEVKEERVRFTDGGTRATLLERGGGSATARDAEGARVTFPFMLEENESVLAQLIEPHRFPVVSRVRQELGAWRFYHHFRTDAEAPIRRPQVGVRTSVLAHDGVDVAAALRTIVEIGDGARLEAHVARAFPGTALDVAYDEHARFWVQMRLPGIQRALEAAELSDGTLRYLCLVAALLSPRPAPLLVLNEPETSLHPDLFAPLGELILDAATRSQVIVTTHAERLVERLARAPDVNLITLERKGAETVLKQ